MTDGPATNRGPAPRPPRSNSGGRVPAAAKARSRSSRRDVASGSKVAAAGVGFAAMLGLVAAMGAAARSAPTTDPPATPSAARSEVVVRIPTAAPPATDPPGMAPAVETPAPSSLPIPLQARPTVRQAPQSPAPSARTHGSR